MNGCELVAISCVLFGYTENSDSHNNSIVKDWAQRERYCRGNVCVFDQNCKITNCSRNWHICFLCDWFVHNCWMLTELLFSFYVTDYVFCGWTSQCSWSLKLFMDTVCFDPNRPAERWPVAGCPDVQPAQWMLACLWDDPASSPTWSGIYEHKCIGSQWDGGWSYISALCLTVSCQLTSQWWRILGVSSWCLP